MKPTKIRNRQIYRATQNTLSTQMGAHLSKDLRQKYGKRSARITIGDSVKILRGEYKGIDGKVTKVSLLKNSIAIEGIKKEKSKGEKIDVYIRSSNVVITGLNTDDKWRRNKLEGKKKKSILEEKVRDAAKSETPKQGETGPKTEAEQVLLDSEKIKEVKTTKDTKPTPQKKKAAKKSQKLINQKLRKRIMIKNG